MRQTWSRRIAGLRITGTCISTVGCMLVGCNWLVYNQTGGSRISRLHCFAAIAWKLDQGPLVLVLAREADAVEALT